MRIAFLGKGGAGKTTTAAGFIRYVAKLYPYVLAVDADVNAHLKGALHVDGLEDEDHGGEEPVRQAVEHRRGDVDAQRPVEADGR